MACVSDEAAVREAIEVAIARRREVFALSDLARTANGYSVKFRLGVVDVVRTAIAAGVFHDLLRPVLVSIEPAALSGCTPG